MSRKVMLLVVVLCLVIAGSVWATAGRISIFVNGERVQAAAIEQNGVTYLPVRAVAEALGVPVQYDEVARTVYVGSGGKVSSRPSRTYRQPAPQQKIQDEVHITRSGKKYHVAGCRYLSKSDIPILRKDAEARGLTPCSVCNP